MKDEVSLPMSEFIFLKCFSQLTNCNISMKHTKPSLMTPGHASQTTPVHTMHVLCCVVLQIEVCNFDSPSICVQQHNMNKTCIICTGVVWLGSPAAIELSSLCTNEAYC